MVAPNVKAETMGLIDRRAALEAEMNAIIAVLSASGGPGITGGLVDAEGFPRSDIDTPTVLAQRRKHAGTSASMHSSLSQSDLMEEDLVTRLTFAMIDEITDGSPAAVDGLQLGMR